jgi:sulfide dehydrogenase [flavocytochrome c] flavoprotein subunit
MSKLTRRAFGRLAGAASLALARPGAAFGRTRGKVVVIGGGFGGATAAKYLRLLEPGLDVTLVEPSRVFYTCPFSNLVIAGLRPLTAIAQRYGALASKYGVRHAADAAAAIDPDRKTARLRGGQSLPYDRLIVSPGIDLRWGAVPGYDEAAAQIMPHAWKAGAQTMLLRRQLAAMPDGGLVIISPPPNPARCPPGPYERASLIAHYLKAQKPRSKILILDPKERFAKQALFQAGWKKLYPGMIDWRGQSDDGTVVRVDTKTMTVESDFGEHYKGAVVNFIPPQTAGRIATAAGFADRSGWCPVNQLTFESTLYKGVYVIGDAAIASPMPKSGFSANSQAKIAALAVIASLKGQLPAEPSLANTCYSLVGPDYGISVAAVYRFNGQRLASVKDAGGVSPANADPDFRRQEARYAEGWYASITRDVFG